MTAGTSPIERRVRGGSRTGEASHAEPRVAVLPFENAHGDPNLDYFCEGLAAELLISLARIPGLHLIARSAVFSLPPEGRGIRDIQRQLTATAVLRGSVAVKDEEIDLAVELVDVSSEKAIWTALFDRALKDVFKVLDEISAGVAEALNRAEEHIQVRTIQSLHSEDVKAYDRYMRGRQAYLQYSRQSNEEALQLFREAIEVDGDYALAFAGIADCYSYRYMYVESSDSNMQEAVIASRHALELDPNLAEAHASLGLALSLQGKYDESERAFIRATELDPKLFEAHYFFARACFAQGKLEEALTRFNGARKSRPEDYQAPLLMGQIYDSLGRPELAQSVRREGVALAERHLATNPDDTRALYMGANGLVALGDERTGLNWLERALEIGQDDAMLLYNAGCIYALLGRTSEALNSLEKTVAGGLTQKEWYENDSNLDSLRGIPRFQALLSSMG